MANLRISQLPAANELWNLNELVAVVNSGNTTTSKRTYGSLFSNHSGGTYTITSNQQTYAVIASGSISPLTHIRIGGIDNAAVIASRGANITSGQMNTIIGCEQDSDSNQPTINGGQYNSIIASKGNISTSGNWGFIAGSTNSHIQGSERNSLMSVEQSTIGSNSYYNSIIASNNITHGTYAGGGYKVVSIGSASGNIEAATEAVILASRQFTSHLQGSNTMSMIATKNATIEPVSFNAEVMSILNSSSSTLRPNAHHNIIINSDSVSIDDSTSSNTKMGAAINAWGGNINGNNLGNNYQKMLINTYGTIISHGGSRVMAINANGGTISATGDHNMLLNTESIDITGSVNKATKIGVWDATHTTTIENTTHTDNLYAYDRIGGETNVSTTISNQQTLEGGKGMVQYTDVPAGNLNLQINDVRNGEVYHWVISNDTGGSISLNSTATNTGYTIHTDVGGGSYAAGKHMFTIAVVNNIIMVQHPH